MDAPFAYLSKLTLQKAHLFSDPGPFINPLPVLIIKINGLIVVIGLLPQFILCKKLLFACNNLLTHHSGPDLLISKDAYFELFPNHCHMPLLLSHTFKYATKRPIIVKYIGSHTGYSSGSSGTIKVNVQFKLRKRDS